MSGLVSHSLKVAGIAYSSVQMLPVSHGFWLGNVHAVTVGMMSLMHLSRKLVTEVVYSSMPLDESRNIVQSVLAKQSFGVASA